MDKKRFTLEKHLRQLGKIDINIKSLESVYDLQRRKLDRYLASMVTVFPTYSTHDTFHSVSIISAIEAILGKKYMKRLSGVDTFFILMCAYMHDIGMLYTDTEVRNIWDSAEFTEFLNHVQNKSDELKKAAELVSGKIETGDEGKFWPLEIRQSITILLMEYYRSRHGTRIEQITKKDSGSLANLLRVEDSFLPDRIIKMINIISMAHTWEFNKIMENLPKEDFFYGEYFHPRMIAFLLRLGDLCDLDNNRFNKVGIATFGTLGDESLAHYFKHKSVETLYISDEKINIVANIIKEYIETECRREWMVDEKDEKKLIEKVEKVFQRTVKEHIIWKSWMEQEIVHIKLNKHQILPSKLNIQIPEISYKIKINGEDTVSSDQNLKFNLSPEKAFRLIESISLYHEAKFIFLRELIQNAIDASKLQLWRDICSELGDESKRISPFELERKYPGIYEKYKIEIQLNYDLENRQIFFRFKDSGIGISIPELKENILIVGNSWKKREQYRYELQQMPKWLRPTGTFGIGLHTVFAITDQMKILTKSESEERANEITLCSGKKDGYVFCEKSKKLKKRGTIITFTYKLTEEQEQVYLAGYKDESFFKSFENEMESTIISQIKHWCISPLFPIWVNQKPVVAEFTKKIYEEGFVMEPSDVGTQEKKRNLEHKIQNKVKSSRYFYLFSNDYKKFLLWDKEEELLMSLQLVNYVKDPSDHAYEQLTNTSFNGIFLRRYSYRTKQRYIFAEKLDILAEGNHEIINAARSDLTYKAYKRYSLILEDGIQFAKICYQRLAKELYIDADHQKFMQSIACCANRYYKKEHNAKSVWKYAVKLEKEFLDQEDIRDIKASEPEIFTFMIGLKIVDAVLHQSIQDWEPDYNSDLYHFLNSLDMSALSLLDYFLQRWHIKHKDCGQQKYIIRMEDQIVSIFKNYIFIYVTFWLDRTTNKNIVAMTNTQVKDLQKKYNHYMSFMSAWHKSKYDYRTIVKGTNKILRDFSKLRRDKPENNIIWNFIPASAKVFENYISDAGFIFDSVLLELSKPYFRLFLDIPNKNMPINQLDQDAWKQEFTGTLFGLLGKGATGINVYSSLLDKKEYMFQMPQEAFEYDLLPFHELVTILKVTVKENCKSILFSISKQENTGIAADEKTQKDGFLSFWNMVDSEEEQFGSLPIIGFDKYPALIMNNEWISYDYWLEIYWKRNYIPSWNSAFHMKKQMDKYRHSKDREACFREIIESQDFSEVTKYIWERKVKTNMVTLRQVQEQYKHLVQDLIDVWFEKL